MGSRLGGVGDPTVAYLDQFLGMVHTPLSPMLVVPDKLGYGRGGRFGFVAIAILLFAIRAIWPLARITSKRLRASTLAELARRGAVFAIFLVISLVLAADTRRGEHRCMMSASRDRAGPIALKGNGGAQRHVS